MFVHCKIDISIVDGMKDIDWLCRSHNTGYMKEITDPYSEYPH